MASPGATLMQVHSQGIERQGQRREPAADVVRFVASAERLAPVRCTGWFGESISSAGIKRVLCGLLVRSSRRTSSTCVGRTIKSQTTVPSGAHAIPLLAKKFISGSQSRASWVMPIDTSPARLVPNLGIVTNWPGGPARPKSPPERTCLSPAVANHAKSGTVTPTHA